MACSSIWACGAGGGGSKIGNSASGGDGGNAGGLSGGAGGAGAITGFDGGVVRPDGGCQQYDIVFEPRTPTVFVLVDRSGTMFDASGATNAWEPLRAAALEVIQALQAEVRFGFGAFTGEIGQTCPIFDTVAPELNNFPAIQGVYAPLGRPVKGETPTQLALALAKQALVADPGNGGKYILFVTDGEPDYCSDGDDICPVDSVVFHLQRLASENIKTLVLGLTTTAQPVPQGGLEAWANAGQGQPVAMFSDRGSPRLLTTTEIYDKCNGRPPWRNDFAAPGPNRDTNPTLGRYSTPGGNAPVYRPTSLDRMELARQLRAAFQGVKSCRFDLQGRIKVNLMRQGEGTITIDGQEVPFGPPDGWHMESETELVLEGASCARWQQPDSIHISFDFPCDAIIPPPR